jgi:hypothetical protein
VSQYDLYGGLPPHERNSETSREAAKQIEPSAQTLRQRILCEITARGAHGMTCDEVEVALAMRHQTASARIRELFLKDQIVSRGTRKTRSGRPANIWVKKTTSPDFLAILKGA